MSCGPRPRREKPPRFEAGRCGCIVRCQSSVALTIDALLEEESLLKELDWRVCGVCIAQHNECLARSLNVSPLRRMREALT